MISGIAPAVIGFQDINQKVALKYRFGWKKSDKIHYYSELLGMKDTIAEEDLLMDVTKTEIEKRLEKSEKEKEIMQERLNSMELQMAKIMEVTDQTSHGSNCLKWKRKLIKS